MDNAHGPYWSTAVMKKTASPKMATNINSHIPQQRFQYGILDAGFVVK